MKKYMLLIVFIVVLLLFDSCSGLNRTDNTEAKLIEPHPGIVLSYSSPSDGNLLLLGYPFYGNQDVTQPKVLSGYYKTDDEVAGKKQQNSTENHTSPIMSALEILYIEKSVMTIIAVKEMIKVSSFTASWLTEKPTE